MASTSTDANGNPRKMGKPVLDDPERIEMIKTHRAMQSAFGAGGNLVMTLSSSGGIEPNFPKKVPKNLKEVFVSEMDPEQEWVFMKKVLHLTLIEDPMVGFTPIHQIAEDRNGDTIQLFIHEVAHTKKMLDLLCFGQQIAVINPYMRIALDGRHGIRIDDPYTMVILGRKTKVCRYCGSEYAEHRCAKCKRDYCSRACQVSDWKELDHKRICKA